MSRVKAVILHALPDSTAGPLELAFATARAANADHLGRGFESAGADVSIEPVRPGIGSFGTSLRRIRLTQPRAGLVILGSGSVPLATEADLRAFVAAAADGPVLSNNCFSSDIVAIPASVALDGLPDLAGDNGLPRWLADRGIDVIDLRRRWRLQVDLDSPLDVVLAGDRHGSVERALAERVAGTAGRIRAVSRDPASELVIAGRTSSRSLRWLERNTASRTRAIVEERGMRTALSGQRPTRSLLGLLLDRDGPESLGRLLAELGEAAVVDSRVLLAHRLGSDDSRWPRAEDRFASDLLHPEHILDPWLRALTASVVDAPIPILLGGHTLVGPGMRLLLRDRA